MGQDRQNSFCFRLQGKENPGTATLLRPLGFPAIKAQKTESNLCEAVA